MLDFPNREFPNHPIDCRARERKNYRLRYDHPVGAHSRFDQQELGSGRPRRGDSAGYSRRLRTLTLAYNRGAAFGISLGDDSRWFFIPITILALVLLLVLLRQAQRRDWLRLVSISMVVAGALGNLYDRVRWDRGVVDFIGPINLGFMDWPIFNVADMSITCGAVLLAISFWGEERRERAAAVVLEEGEPTASG